MRAAKLFFVSLLAFGMLACESRTDRTDGGGIILSISDFDGLPLAVSVNSGNGFVQVEEIQVTSVIKDPNLVGSSLMNVEISSFEVTYSRADTGTRLPPKFVRGLFGVVPAGGEFTVDNLPVMAPEQFDVPPLSDLYFRNGGYDKETGSDKIILNCHIRFFGRTLSGDAVISEPGNFTLTITP
jgi:hypothetical protein